MKQITFLTFLFCAAVGTFAQDLRITEIMYNPGNTDSSWEWIEVYNAGTELIDLSGYVIDDNSGADYGEANIPSGNILSGKSAILFNASKLSESDFQQAWGTVNLIPVTRWSSLNNSGDTIGIWNSFESYLGDSTSQENVIEQVTYAADGTWPEDDGTSSIYLSDLNADSSDGSNWLLSTTGMITPLFKTYVSTPIEIGGDTDIGSPGLPGITDIVKPEITCPELIDMLSDEGNCAATIALVLPTATDNISTQFEFEGTRNDGLALADLFPIGDTAITWTATDEAGNVSDNCTQIIRISDQVSPVLNCPEAITRSSEDGNPIVIEIDFATASDACEGELDLSFIRSDNLSFQEPFSIGTTTITWEARDASGNVSECEQLITVNSTASMENEITSFSISEQLGESIIDSQSKTVSIKVLFGTDITALVPNIEISEGATVSPNNESVQDFTLPIAYTVNSEDGSEAVWMVTVEVEEEDEEEEKLLAITSFVLVNADTNEDLFPLEEGMQIDVTALPTLHLDIRANTSEDVESVRLSLAGAQTTTRTESLIPYALYQDLPIGNYKGNEFIAGAYTVSATPYASDSTQGEIGNSLSLNFELISTTGTLEIESFTLINADTNEALFELEQGMVIDINSLPTNHLDIRANTTDDVESVKLSLSGSQTSSRTESLEPYALFQDLPIGNYKGNNFATGNYSVIAVPYSEDSAKGSLGSSFRIDFELVDSGLEVLEFILVNAETDEDLFSISEGMQIDINALPTLNLDIRANTSEAVESVRLSISGALNSSRVESLVPYALFQDLPIGNYKGNIFQVGSYSVSGETFSENSGQGQPGNSLSINFELIDSIASVGGQKSNTLIISPNPAWNETRLSFKKSVEITTIDIYDNLGRLMKTFVGKEVEIGDDYLVQLQSLPYGNYFVRARDTNGNFHNSQLLISRE
ncbi:HYR domain-containing protein [Maribacter sp. 2308TA10-17]|uniref:HYR domain-containing protein n=1 Tax=Maribacter sp. 2308TA10-17 TaxID=3386276 RepID=UPI0039BC991F